MNESRREFLKKSGCALSMAALATQVQHLGMMSTLAQKMDDSAVPEGGANYKALVLVYWSGGNDGNNIVIPNHNDANLSNYAAYAAARQAQAWRLPKHALPSRYRKWRLATVHPAFGQLRWCNPASRTVGLGNSDGDELRHSVLLRQRSVSNARSKALSALLAFRQVTRARRASPTRGIHRGGEHLGPYDSGPKSGGTRTDDNLDRRGSAFHGRNRHAPDGDQ